MHLRLRRAEKTLKHIYRRRETIWLPKCFRKRLSKLLRDFFHSGLFPPEEVFDRTVQIFDQSCV